jgi:hypothetical protein
MFIWNVAQEVENYWELDIDYIHQQIHFNEILGENAEKRSQ